MSPSLPALEASPEAPLPRRRPESAPPSARAGVFCFSIQAEAEPSVMSRVLELFAKRNLVPARWVSDVVGPGERELSIDLQVCGLSGDTALYVARCLRQLHYVDSVLISEKRVL